jgi:hypothetical protein
MSYRLGKVPSPAIYPVFYPAREGANMITYGKQTKKSAGSVCCTRKWHPFGNGI